MNAKELSLLERRKLVAERYLRLETQWEIGRALGVNQSTISRDLAAVREEWVASKDVAVDQVVARELAKIDHVEATYWRAWEKSCGDKETRTGKTVKGDSPREEAGKRIEGRDGNPEYLKGVERCIRLRAEIVGIIKDRREISGPDGSPIPISVTVVEDAAWFGQPRAGEPAAADAASNPGPA